jgi:type 1 glutamine amidotransferase
MSVPQAEDRIEVVLVAAGRYHDIDYARLQLLALLHEDENVRVRVFEDYSCAEALATAQVLVTYTCDVGASAAEALNLKAFLDRGGRWFALHGTNAMLEFLENGVVDTPDRAPELMTLLGSRFLSHPPGAPYRVEVADPSHPLVAGIEPFEANDELYLSDYLGKLHVLLDTEFAGQTPNFTCSEWPQARHPVLYLHEVGKGAVLYLTLGHCRSPHDMRPFMDIWPRTDRNSWELPVFRELLRRGVAWSKNITDNNEREEK